MTPLCIPAEDYTINKPWLFKDSQTAASSEFSTFVDVYSNTVVVVGAELTSVVVVAVAECPCGSLRLNISRETSTHPRLVIMSASFAMFSTSITFSHVRHRGYIATRYFLDYRVRIQT